MAKCWTPTTSAWAGRLVCISRSRVPWAIAASQPRFPRRLSGFYVDILRIVTRAKISGSFLRATAMRSCATTWRDRRWMQLPAICPRDVFPAAWKADEMSQLFPMFLKLDGKRCLVVGAGRVGEPKIGGLIDTGAAIHVVSLEASDV